MRVAVDVLEGIGAVVGHGHELDHAQVRMAGHARLLVELAPSQEVVAQRVGQRDEEFRDAGLIHQANQAVNIDEAGHGAAPCVALTRRFIRSHGLHHG
ncbi:hypothetical protein D3C72_2121440 [compost metagenome]